MSNFNWRYLIFAESNWSFWLRSGWYSCLFLTKSSLDSLSFSRVQSPSQCPGFCSNTGQHAFWTWFSVSRGKSYVFLYSPIFPAGQTGHSFIRRVITVAASVRWLWRWNFPENSLEAAVLSSAGPQASFILCLLAPSAKPSPLSATARR